MVAKIIKVIPGESYKVGDNARFDQQRFIELRNKGFVKAIGDEASQGPEIAVIKPKRSSIEPRK